MTRRVEQRTYQKGQRWYGDFRDFADVGGRQEALQTDDEGLAGVAAARRLEELQQLRRRKLLYGAAAPTTLAAYARTFLIQRAEQGTVTRVWLGQTQTQLQRAVDFFGATCPLGEISPGRVKAWAAHLQRQRFGPRTVGPGTARHHLNSLSRLYRHAIEDGLARTNPVRELVEKPRGRPQEARWLEPDQAALMLELARTRRPRRADLAVTNLHALLATFLLTGGRKKEVLGLLAEDISLERQLVVFRPNAFTGGRFKTEQSARPVPLWPQLAEILGPLLVPADRPPPSGLLFPGTARDGTPQLLGGFTKTLDWLAAELGWERGSIRTRMFRHTYCAARLQTLDGGAPVSPFTVGRELGHNGEALVKRIYGHLGTVRQRSDVVEFRIGPHAARLQPQLDRLNGNKLSVTAPAVAPRKSLQRP